MENSFIYILIAIVAGAATGFVSFALYKNTIKAQREASEKEQKSIIDDARREADAIKKEAVIQAKDMAYQAKVEAEKEIRERMRELNQFDKRLRQKEEQLEKKLDQIERRDQDFAKKEKDFSVREKSFSDKEAQYDQILRDQTLVLERLSAVTSEEAKQELFRRVEEETRFESAKLAKRIEDETKESAEKKAKEIISFAIQRYSSDFVADATVSAISLPSDEMKGRIIGREGRNIRAFEAATGVDLVVDDTPELVTMSAHDPVRREVAKIALERLVSDGRIHPTRIEEVVEKVKKEVDSTIREEGEKAVFDLGISGIHPDLIRVIGRLKYRTSYGQNVLQHSKEVAFLAGMMAGELGVDIKLAKR
ncbi:MAG: Rnase Y domain-containing protein, partial [Thermodesulfovibrionales bacterium]